MKLKVASGQVITATLLEFEPEMTTQDARVTAMHQYNPIYRFMCNKKGIMVHANKMAWEAYSTSKHIIMPLQAKTFYCVSEQAVWVHCMQMFADRDVYYTCMTHANLVVLLCMPGSKQDSTGTDATCCTYDLKNALHPVAGYDADCPADSFGA